MDVIPKTMKATRACLGCSLIKSYDQFLLDGCDNCEEFLQMKNNRDTVQECTSSNFEGMVALMNPEDSWVARWQKIDKFKIGVYALSVAGKLPKTIVREMKNSGISYCPRDTTLK